MKQSEMLLLKLIRSTVLQSEEDFSEFHSFAEWGELFALCSKHSVVGIVFDKIIEAFGDSIPEIFASRFKQKALSEMSFQAVRSQSFKRIYGEIKKENITAVVLKGEILRQLYPQPESRTSLDEDLLIDEKDYEMLKKVMTSLGLEEVNEGENDKHWMSRKNGTYLEIHFTPFENEKTYESWNKIFDDWKDKSIENENGIVALSREDNLIFLILHAAKHFIYSGVGIKQILDIALFMKSFQKNLDFSYIERALKKSNTLYFAEALTAFIKNYLYEDVYCFGKTEADCEFFQDVFGGGSLGKGDESRVHSANVTSSAFKGKSKIKKILFPPKERLFVKYPFCRKYKILLPLAWIMRLFSYLLKGKKTSALKTGNARLQMLKKYGLIK